MRQLGVTVVKSSPDLTMVVHLRSPNERYDMLYLRNYATLNVKDQLARVRGVGQVRLFGSGDYAMRIWLNPDEVAERNMTADEVLDAVRRQNVQVAAGQIGGAPSASSLRHAATHAPYPRTTSLHVSDSPTPLAHPHYPRQHQS